MARPLDTIRVLRQQRKFKITFLYILSFFLSFIFWFLMKANFDFIFLTTEGLQSLFLSLFSLLFFALFFGLFSNIAYLFRKIYLVTGLIFLINLPYFFIFGLSWFSFMGYAILLLGFYIWARRMDHYDNLHAPFNPLLSGRIGLRNAITIFLLVIAFSLYIHIAYQGQASFFLERLERYTVTLTHQSFKVLLPGYNENQPIDNTLKLILQNKFWQQFLSNGNSIDLANPRVVNAIRDDLSSKINQDLTGQSTDYFVKVLVKDYVINTLAKYQQLFSGATAIALFLFLKIFTIVYYLFIRLSSWLWLKLFLLTKIVSRTKETVEVEKISL
jgi:hypothetical protein